MTTLAVVADLHIGSTVGLCPPTVTLDDGGIYQHSQAQAWLWECWLSFWDRVRQMSRDDELVVVWLGDIIENLHHSTTQLWSANQNDWFRAAEVVFQLVRPVSHQFFLRGTEAHDGVAGQLIEACAPENVVTCGALKTWWSLALDLDGVLIEFWHHGRVGQLPWTRANILNRISSEIVVEYTRDGRRVPDMVITGHTHIYDESSPRTKPAVISMPAWQLKTGYSYRVSAFRRSSIGGLILVCKEGKILTRQVLLYKAQEQKPWTSPSKT